MAEGTEALEVFIIASDGIAGGYTNPGQTIIGVDMHIHDKRLGLLVVKSLWPFKHPPRPKLLGVGKLEDLVAKGPMRQILRAVATDIALRAIHSSRAVFAEPVVSAAKFEDSASMRLNMLAAVVEPDRSGLDGLRGG